MDTSLKRTANRERMCKRTAKLQGAFFLFYLALQASLVSDGQKELPLMQSIIERADW